MGKFSSDPIERRFGWFRQLSGANFYISCKQLFEAEKKIRVLSLIRDGTTMDPNILRGFVPPVHVDDDQRDSVHLESLLQLKTESVTEDIATVDRATIYLVAGYAGRSVSRVLRCDDCKAILTTKSCSEMHVPDATDISSSIPAESEPCACAVPPKKKRKLVCSVNSKEHFVSSVDRGGLSHATEVSFTVCALAYAYFEQIKSDEALQSTFLCSKNQQRCFVNSVLFTLDSESQFNYLKEIKCTRNHLILSPLLKCIFNCFAQNFRRQIDNIITPNLASEERKLRKLTSKSTQKN